MLHRNNPPNQGLWNGVGGHLEAGENPLEGCLREIREETGYQLNTARFCGTLTWQGYEIEAGGLYIFTAEAPTSAPAGNGEGRLAWKTIRWACTSPRVVSNILVFLPLVLSGAEPVNYHFNYDHGQITRHEVLPLSADIQSLFSNPSTT